MRILHLRTLLVVALLAATTSVAHAQKTIKIDFNSTAKFTESDGVEGTATASGVTDAQKAAIIKKVQEKYDTALGMGKVVVSEGTGGDVNIILNGGKAPGALAGKEYGDAGKPGQPGVAHLGEFKGNAAFNDDTKLANAVGETIAHEAAHKFGVSHNEETPPKLMTRGSLVTNAQRAADAREFTANDTKILQNALKNGSSERKDSAAATDLGVSIGQDVPLPANEPDNRYLDTLATFQGPIGSEFGYMSNTGEFVPQGDYTNDASNPTTMTFLYNAGTDLAVELNNMLYTLDSGAGFFHLSHPNPDNPNVFLTADAYFPIPGQDTAHLTLDATVVETTGGFYVVPEPGTLSLLILGVPALIRRRRR